MVMPGLDDVAAAEDPTGREAGSPGVVWLRDTYHWQTMAAWTTVISPVMTASVAVMFWSGVPGTGRSGTVVASRIQPAVVAWIAIAPATAAHRDGSMFLPPES